MIFGRSRKTIDSSVENPLLQKVDKLKDAEYLKMLNDVKVDSTDPQVFPPVFENPFLISLTDTGQVKDAIWVAIR